MPYRALLKKLFSSRTTLLTTVAGTGGYVSYTDHMRYTRMMNAFRHGNILCPFSENQYESDYFHRPGLEASLNHMLEARFSNEYYFVRGEVGSGKSRSLVEAVRELIRTSGANGEGAPVYVLASQGKNFTDSLGEAVRFNFDEHVNFSFLASYVVGIDKFPSRDERHKLVRVLDAIEKSACRYAQTYGKPVVLVIDGSNILTEHLPGALEKLQEKAKLWADANICKVIFVSNEEKTEDLLLKNTSCWSRVGTPLYVDDLTTDESIGFLTKPLSVNTESQEFKNVVITHSRAEEIYNLVGGRIHYLLIFKRDASDKVPFEDTKSRLMSKEREKFIGVKERTDIWKILMYLLKKPTRSCNLSDIITTCCREAIDECIERGIVKLVRESGAVTVKFESKLTESLAERKSLQSISGTK